MDWYSLGVLIFEMFTGEPPFFSDSQSKIFANICEETLVIPETIPEAARDLISNLMDREPSNRLKGLKKEGIKGHSWFKNFGIFQFIFSIYILIN